MLPGLDLIAAGGLLILSSGGGVPTCTIPKAPAISINPTTQPIQYDFSKSKEELTAQMIGQSGTINPYESSADTTTGGYRDDKPQTSMKVAWGYQQYPGDVICLWYDKVEVSIELNPKIYVASDYPKGKCRDEILKHEKRHVAVDHQVFNKYAMDIGQAIKTAVDGVGAMGPYNLHDLESAQERLQNHVEAALNSKELLLAEDMRRRQAQVDTLEEYERVSAVCNKEEEKKSKRGRRRR